MSSTPLYEERRGWSSSSVATSLIIVLIAVLGFVGYAFTDADKLLVLGVLATFGLVFNTVNLARRGLALRVDGRGITLVPPSLRASAGEFIPWSDVRGIVVHKPRHRDELGVIKQYAGIPAQSHTAGGSSKPDSTVVIAGWSLDIARFTESVHAYAPDVAVVDERIGGGVSVTGPSAASCAQSVAPTQPASAMASRRATFLAATLAAVLALVIGLVIAFHKDGTDGYGVQPGPVGTPVILSFPHRLGDLTYLMDDGSPIWKYQPQVLPAGPTSAYSTISGSYASIDPSVAGVDIDAIYANGGNGHVGTFTLAPSALASYAWSGLYGDPQKFPSGTADGVLECGTYGDMPMCIWAGQSALVFVQYDGTPGTLAQLAALTPGSVAALQG